tara:strand:- start:1755 stop:2684 length:930 start_codon:yes stop_codon:yes gene_type:complete
MRVLITGGFGFLGGRLGKYLSTLGYEVILGSRKKRIKPKWVKKGSTVQLEWENHDSLLKICEGVDIVVHAAGLNALESKLDPKLAFKVNGDFTKSLFLAAESCGVKKFIFISTAHVYKPNIEGLIHENSLTTNKHPYAESNVLGENLILSSKNKEIEKVVIRLSNSFGAPERKEADCWNLVINNLCKEAVEKKSLTINGPSDNYRNFITMTDVCCAIEFLIKENKIFNSIIFNLGDRTKSIYEMALLINRCLKEVLNIDVPIIEKGEYSPRELKSLKFSSELIKSKGFELTSNYEQEIKNLINFTKINF